MTKDDIYMDKFTNLSVVSNFITDYLLLYLKSTILVNDCVLIRISEMHRHTCTQSNNQENEFRKYIRIIIIKIILYDIR